RTDAANCQCSLARVLGSSDFTNAIAVRTVLISEGNVSAGPAGFFFSLIVLNGRPVTAGYPPTNPYHGMTWVTSALTVTALLKSPSRPAEVWKSHRRQPRAEVILY